VIRQKAHKKGCFESLCKFTKTFFIVFLNLLSVRIAKKVESCYYKDTPQQTQQPNFFSFSLLLE